MNEFLNLPIKIAVSSCLAGEAVRYDASDKNNSLIVNQYSKYFSLHKICPEVAIGLGVPRNPIILTQYKGDHKKFNLVEVDNVNCNYTSRMLSYAKHRADDLKLISGYIVKERSPSCGLHDTPRYTHDGTLLTHGPGLFIESLLVYLPWLPIISESELDDVQYRENFLERVFIVNLWNLVYKSNDKLDDFFVLISDQLQLRGSSVSALKEQQVSTNNQNLDSIIIIIMDILKKPVTKAMHLKFLLSKLQEYKLKKHFITDLVLNYENNKISLWDVIKHSQQVFKHNNIAPSSNFFYPDAREVNTRVVYFNE